MRSLGESAESTSIEHRAPRKPAPPTKTNWGTGEVSVIGVVLPIQTESATGETSTALGHRHPCRPTGAPCRVVPDRTFCSCGRSGRIEAIKTFNELRWFSGWQTLPI